MISNPIKEFKNAPYSKGDVTQGFGENLVLYASLNAGLTKGHNGLDIVAPWGTPIYAVESGIVCEVKDSPSGYGKYVRVLSETGNEWTYGHLSAITVTLGTRIEVGSQICNMGNTGFVVSDVNALGYWVKGSNKYAGTHLHLGCRKYVYDVAGWKPSPGTHAITILNYDNGSLGSVDFSSWFDPNGDIEIFKRELEKQADQPSWMKLIWALKWFGFK